MKTLTKKAKQNMLELSKQNESLGNWTFRGIDFKLIGTFINSNGSVTVEIRNEKTREVKRMGSGEWDKILKQYL